MNIKKKIPAGECGAKRCNEPATCTVLGECWDMDGVRVPLCDRHVQEADDEFKLHEVDDGIVALAPGKELVAAIPAEDLEAVAEAVAKDPQVHAETKALVAAVEQGLDTPVPSDHTQEIAAEAETAKDVLDYVKTMEIANQEDLDFAAESLAEVKGRAKRLEARLQEITKPMNEALKSVRALFKPVMEAYGEIERELKARIAEHAAAQEEANRQAMMAAADGDTEALANVTSIAEVGGLSVRSTWDFIIEDEALLPREFLIPNEKKLGAHARAAKDGAPAPIPGVRFVPKQIVASRSA